jgi:hypothetical protein
MVVSDMPQLWLQKTEKSFALALDLTLLIPI